MLVQMRSSWLPKAGMAPVVSDMPVKVTMTPGSTLSIKLFTARVPYKEMVAVALASRAETLLNAPVACKMAMGTGVPDLPWAITPSRIS